MTKLTELPLPILQTILHHLDRGIPERHHYQRYTTSFLPNRHPGVHPSLDCVKDADAVLPGCVLAPALASPVLAAACERNLGTRVSYLTYYNTGGRVGSWVAAFAPWVSAVCAGFVAEDWDEGLGTGLRAMRVEKVCRDTVELFRTISVRNVRLFVLDVVNVPFDECEGVEDELMAALCGMLEATSRTLKELALPVYPKSDICALALESVTLPHLSVLSIELMNGPSASKLTISRIQRTRHAFLRMMQAADGHADRSRRLTVLEELRVFNMYFAPCAVTSESGCSAGFFRAVRTLRVYWSTQMDYVLSEHLNFLSLFENLQYFYSNLIPGAWLKEFKLRKRLKELHFCYPSWMTGVQIGPDFIDGFAVITSPRVLDGIKMSREKIVTLATYDYLDATDLMDMAEGCPNLRYLSIFVTTCNVCVLRGIIEKCTKLTGLEMKIYEERYGQLGNGGWKALGKTIPQRHAHLKEIAIQPKDFRVASPAPVDGVTGCFLDVVKRLGPRAERLVFRALVDCWNIARNTNAVFQVLDACTRYSRVLAHLRVDIVPGRGSHKDRHSPIELNSMVGKLNVSRDMLMSSQPNLRKLNLGLHQRLLVLSNPLDPLSENAEVSKDAEDAEETEETEDTQAAQDLEATVENSA